MLYRIVLSRVDGKRIPYARYLERDTDAEAVDAAKRELRRSRRANVGISVKFDQWAVRRRVGNKAYQTVAEGLAE